MNDAPDETTPPITPALAEPILPVPPSAETLAPSPDPLPPAGSLSVDAPKWESLLATIESLHKKADDLSHYFDQKLRSDAGREAVIDRLHAELQEYKADIALKFTKPIALEMIQIHDAIRSALANHERASENTASKLLTLLENLKADIEDGLYRHGFEPFTCDQPEFDPRRQRVTKPVPTDDPAKDKLVAERLRKGVIYEGKVIVRPETVTVHVFQREKQN